MQPPPPPWRRRERELVLDDEAAERRAVRDALAALRRLRRGRGEALPLLGVAQRRGGRGVAVAAAADGGPEEPAPGLGGVGGAAHDLASEGAEAEVVEEAAGAHLAEVGGRRRGLASRPLLLGPLVEEDDAGAVDDVGLHPGDVHEALDVGHPDDVVVGGAPDLDGVVVAVGLRQAQRAQGARARARARGGAVQAEHVALAAAVRVAVRPAVREEARRKQRLQPARPLPRVRRRGDLLLLLRLRVRAAAALHGQPCFRQLTRFARWRSI
uniref:Uncharacterized protein n=1 Tax=Zea mays TaxID=4577 RepID=A0A804LNN7_MAIZE